MLVPLEKDLSFTKKQGQYLAFINHYIKTHGYPPTHSEMQQYFNVLPTATNAIINHLKKKGLLIKKSPGEPRSIRLLIPEYLIPELEKPDKEEGSE